MLAQIYKRSTLSAPSSDEESVHLHENLMPITTRTVYKELLYAL